MTSLNDENRSIDQTQPSQQMLIQDEWRNLKLPPGFCDDAPDSVAEQVICEDGDQEELQYYIL